MFDGLTDVKATPGSSAEGALPTFTDTRFVITPRNLPAIRASRSSAPNVDIVPRRNVVIAPSVKPSVKKRFRMLVMRWKAETETLSDPVAMFMTPTYLEIIGLGPAAIPMLLDELANEPDHWFVALRAISGKDPVPPAHRGHISAMTTHWLNWGKRQGLR